jgi:hypothetical protein
MAYYKQITYGRYSKPVSLPTNRAGVIMLRICVVLKVFPEAQRVSPTPKSFAPIKINGRHGAAIFGRKQRCSVIPGDLSCVFKIMNNDVHYVG